MLVDDEQVCDITFISIRDRLTLILSLETAGRVGLCLRKILTVLFRFPRVPFLCHHVRFWVSGYACVWTSWWCVQGLAERELPQACVVCRQEPGNENACDACKYQARKNAMAHANHFGWYTLEVSEMQSRGNLTAPACHRNTRTDGQTGSAVTFGCTC